MGPYNRAGNIGYWFRTWAVSLIFLTATAFLGYGFWFNFDQYRALNKEAEKVYLSYLEDSAKISSETAQINTNVLAIDALREEIDKHQKAGANTLWRMWPTPT